MIRTISCAVSLFACTPAVTACSAPHAETHVVAQAASHDGDSTPRRQGTIYKGQVDDLIGLLAHASQAAGTAAPYATDVRDAARILCAMGHCHRFYVGIDNPRIRATVAVLIGGRRPDGSFGAGEAATDTTAWVADALEVMDAQRYRDEVATARGWLRQHGGDDHGFTAAVQRVLAQVQPGRWPEHLGGAAVAFLQQVEAQPGTPVDRAAATDALVQLVACQEANRMLDRGQQPQGTAFGPTQQKGYAWLLTQQKDGVFSITYEGKTFPDPALTGFGLLALQTRPKAQRADADNKAIEQGLRWLLSQQNDDGSFGRQLQNYTTSVVVGALSRWDDPAAKAAVQKAQKYILKCQNVESTGYQRSDRDYGSIGYGDSQRGDLSNVNFALQALRQSGLPAEDEAFQKALVFLQRSQNLSATNDFAGKVSNPDDGGKLIDVVPSDDGGGVYYPGNSAAGYVVTPDGKSQPRSYGSMTYALLKSYTLCGLAADDPRVAAVVRWVGEHWTLDKNPGFDLPAGDKGHYAGLFYYYMVLAQALDMAGVTTVATTTGGAATQLDWRKQMRERLNGMQAADGSWRNDKNGRWMESSNLLCTCYALLALERCN